MNRKRSLLLALTIVVALISSMVASYVFMARAASAQEEKKNTMFVRLTIAPIKSGKMNDLTTIYKDSIVPAAKAQEGYRGAYLLTNRETNKAVSVTVWNSEKNAIANEQSGYYKEQVAKAIPCFSGAPVREGYEISVSDAPVKEKP
jgi:heme-degrading monooxygenase HmoA